MVSVYGRHLPCVVDDASLVVSQHVIIRSVVEIILGFCDRIISFLTDAHLCTLVAPRLVPWYDPVTLP